MNLKKLAIGAVAALGITAMPAQAAAQFDKNTIQQIAIMLLAEKLGINAGGILGALGGSGGSGGSVFEMAPAIAMQQYAPKSSAQEIWQLRQGGLPWDQVATRVGVPATRYAQLQNSGALNSNVIWRDTFRSELNLSQAQIDRLRRMGLSWESISKAAFISRESGVSIDTVVAQYRRSRNWNQVAQHYNIRNSTVAQRVKTWRTTQAMPARWRKEGHAKTWRPSNSRPKSESKGKKHDKDHSWRPSNSRGEAESNSKKLDHSKSKNKSKSNGKKKGHDKH